MILEIAIGVGLGKYLAEQLLNIHYGVRRIFSNKQMLETINIRRVSEGDDPFNSWKEYRQHCDAELEKILSYREEEVVPAPKKAVAKKAAPAKKTAAPKRTTVN